MDWKWRRMARRRSARAEVSQRAAVARCTRCRRPRTSTDRPSTRLEPAGEGGADLAPAAGLDDLQLGRVVAAGEQVVDRISRAVLAGALLEGQLDRDGADVGLELAAAGVAGQADGAVVAGHQQGDAHPLEQLVGVGRRHPDPRQHRADQGRDRGVEGGDGCGITGDAGGDQLEVGRQGRIQGAVIARDPVAVASRGGSGRS